ncbi:hypothetical protein [Streptomyces iconiensis]|uniref:Uncharacterized protein n=1 Tax=Streptomyces iconiensis TaxID=1384038 RepID=A0ABT7A499_9ACTN|nr:hypothetical protein [Streptomyces iconiensis]MDJ1135448.1 hypothetical protein [Streptomyces iconiensis]
MAAPTIQEYPSGEVPGPPEELADAFTLDPAQRGIDELGVWLGGDEDDGDTTGDNCGESPPQGATTGC